MCRQFDEMTEYQYGLIIANSNFDLGNLTTRFQVANTFGKRLDNATNGGV